MRHKGKINKSIFKVIKKIKAAYKSWKKKQERILLIENIRKAEGRVGKRFDVGNDVMVSGGKKINIGNNVYIGTGSFIRGEGGLVIGNNVVISRNVVIYTASHNYRGGLLPYDESSICNPVIIEDNVWVGMNVTISPGTHIKEGSIIGIGARVYGEVEACSIIGSHGLLIKKRNKDDYLNKKNKGLFANHDGVKV